MTTETRPSICPQCGGPALCTHGLQNAKGFWVHEWDCDTCGEHTATVLDGCDTCEQFATEVSFHGTAEIEAILPGWFHKDREVAFVEVVYVDHIRRWLIACNGFAMVVQPFERDCRLDRSGVVETRDIEGARAECECDTFYLPVDQVGDYPDMDCIVQERVLDKRFTPVAVVDAKVLYDMARAIHHGQKDPKTLPVVLCAEKPATPLDKEEKSGLLVIPPESDSDWETRPWGYLLNFHVGDPGAVQLLRQVFRDTQDRMEKDK